MNAIRLLGLFLAGNLLVAAFWFTLRRFLRREPALAKRRDFVFEMSNRGRRIEATQAELATSNSELKGDQSRAGGLRTKIDERVPLDETPSTMVAYGVLGTILGQAEAGLFYVLSAPAMLFGMPPEVWAFAAPPFAAAGVLALHVVGGHFITDKIRPARTVRRAKWGATLFGAAVIAGVWMTLSGRNLSDANLIEEVVGVGLMVLAALLSITAAMCTLVASTIHESEDDVRRLARLEQREKAYDRHITLLQKDLDRLMTLKPGAPVDGSPIQQVAGSRVEPVVGPVVTPSVGSVVAPVVGPLVTPGGGSLVAPVGGPLVTPVITTPSVPPAAPNGSDPKPTIVDGPARPTAVNAAAIIAAVLISTSTLPTHARAQVPSTFSARVSARPTVPAFARDSVCDWNLDITSSEEQAALQGTLNKLAASVMASAEAFHCTVVRLTPFAGDLFSAIQEFSVPPISNLPCTNETAKKSNTKRSQAVGWIYPAVGASRQRELANACDVQREKEQSVNNIKRQALTAQLADSLRAIGLATPSGPCTALYQAVARSMLRSQHVFVVTDAAPTCTPPPVVAPFPLAPGTHLLFLLIPPNSPGSYDRANIVTERLGWLERQYPGARALLAPEATPTFWTRLKASGL